MYNQSQRFTAIFLLFSMFLQSCTSHPKIIYNLQEKADKQPYKKIHAQSGNSEKQGQLASSSVSINTTATASALLDFPTPSNIVEKLDSSNKSISKLVGAEPSEEFHKLLIDKSTLTKSTSTAQNPPAIQGVFSKQLTEPSQIGKPNAMILAQQAPLVPNKTFRAYAGQKVCFLRQDAIWHAQVTYSFPENSYTSILPVICQGAENIQQFLDLLLTQNPSTSKYRIHILEANQAPYARRYVYLGELGLKGGMQEEKEIAFPLHQAATNGDITRVIALLQTDKYDINARDSGGYTPLERAAQNGHDEVANILLQAGAIASHLLQDKTHGALYHTSIKEEKDMLVPSSQQTSEIDESVSIEILPLHQPETNGRPEIAALVQYGFFPIRESFASIEALHENRLTYLSQMPADHWPVTKSSLEKIKGRISARTDRPDCYKKTKQFLQIAVPALCTGALVFFPVQSSTGKWLAFAVGGGANTLSVAMAWYWASKESREENYLQNTVKEYQEIYKELSLHLLNTMDSIATREIASKINANFTLIKNKFLDLFSQEDTENILNQLKTTVAYLAQQEILHFDLKSDKFLALDEACKQMIQNKYYENKINHCMAEIATLKQKQD
jgi:ankyrin repeat protein